MTGKTSFRSLANSERVFGFLFGLAVFLGSAATATAQGPPPQFTTTPSPPYRSVLEGESGIFDFTIKNVGITEMTVMNVTVSVTPIVFLGGDANDEVFNTQLLNVPNCAGKTLATNGGCQFQQAFQTRDLNPGGSGTNVGIWEIANFVSYSFNNETDGGGKRGTAIVEVRDPGAQSQIPEPASVIVFACGCTILFACRNPRRDSV